MIEKLPITTNNSRVYRRSSHGKLICPIVGCGVTWWDERLFFTRHVAHQHIKCQCGRILLESGFGRHITSSKQHKNAVLNA